MSLQAVEVSNENRIAHVRPIEFVEYNACRHVQSKNANGRAELGRCGEFGGE